MLGIIYRDKYSRNYGGLDTTEKYYLTRSHKLTDNMVTYLSLNLPTTLFEPYMYPLATAIELAARYNFDTIITVVT